MLQSNASYSWLRMIASLMHITYVLLASKKYKTQTWAVSPISCLSGKERNPESRHVRWKWLMLDQRVKWIQQVYVSRLERVSAGMPQYVASGYQSLPRNDNEKLHNLFLRRSPRGKKSNVSLLEKEMRSRFDHLFTQLWRTTVVQWLLCGIIWTTQVEGTLFFRDTTSDCDLLAILDFND